MPTPETLDHDSFKRIPLQAVVILERYEIEPVYPVQMIPYETDRF